MRIEDLLLGSIIRGALGARGKPHFRASRFLTGGASRFGIGLNLPTVIGAAGLAWGAYEHLKDKNPSVLTTLEGGGFGPAGSPPPPPGTPGFPPSSPQTSSSTQDFPSPPPPLPRSSPALSSSAQGSPTRPPPLPNDARTTSSDPRTGPNARSVRNDARTASKDARTTPDDAQTASNDASGASSPGPDALRRLVALTIAAARCDGELGEEEYGKVLAAAREHGAEKLVSEELANRRTIQEIVVGAMDRTFREHLYALAFGIVRADAGISAAERKWLRELALALDLDTQAAARIEQETGNKIDRQIA